MTDGPDRRRCLRCLKWFWSNGFGNRICAKCHDANRYDPPAESVLKRQRGKKRWGRELMERGNGYAI